MSQPAITKSVSYTLTEPEVIAYYELITKRQARGVRSRRSLASTIYVPLALGALLMAVSALRGGPGNADFGPMLATGTIAYLGGIFALRYEFLRNHELIRASLYRTQPLSRESRHITLRDDALEYASPNLNARFRYGAFTDVEIIHGFILGWIGNAYATVVPLRAFATTSEADAFAVEMRNQILAARSVTVK
jgi:hypothetical protein